MPSGTVCPVRQPYLAGGLPGPRAVVEGHGEPARVARVHDDLAEGAACGDEGCGFDVAAGLGPERGPRDRGARTGAADQPTRPDAGGSQQQKARQHEGGLP